MRNVSEFSDDNDSSTVDNWPESTFTMFAWNTYFVISCVALSLGIPGNILSVIVWLRGHVVSKNSSSVYLAALAIVDFVAPTFNLILDTFKCYGGWFCTSCWAVSSTVARLEHLFILSYSAERLIAIRHPLQVCYRCYMYRVDQKSGSVRNLKAKANNFCFD